MLNSNNKVKQTIISCIILISFSLLKTETYAQNTFQKAIGTPNQDELGISLIKLTENRLLHLIQIAENDEVNHNFGLLITDLNGHIIQKTEYELEGNQWPTELLQSSDGGFLLGGRTRYNNKQTGELLKVRQDLTLDWSITLQPGPTMIFSFINEDEQGNIYVGGDFEMNLRDFLLIKLDKDGEELWSRSWGQQDNDHIYDLQILDNGDLLLLCNTWMGFSQDLVIINVSPDGEVLSQKSIFQGMQYYGQSILDLQDNTFLLLGKLYSGETFLVRLNSSLETIWAKKVGANGGDLWLKNGYCHNNKIYLSGNFSRNNGDIAVLALDYLGNIDWLMTYGGYELDGIRHLSESNIVVAENNLYINGFTESFQNNSSDIYLLNLI
ncbi:MAG: hypothetical protein U5L09_23050 [Bacteroidales bacterium]|nr:hypothetical protein [Bacteroidales bacterium]